MTSSLGITPSLLAAESARWSVRVHRTKRLIGLLSLLAALLQPGLGLAAEPPQEPTRSILVGYHRSGESSLGDCAESLWTRRESFSAATRDRSPSLDRWHAKYRAREVRAVFRRPDGTPLAEQARRMSERLNRKRRSTSPTTPRATSPATSARDARQRIERASDFAHVYRIEIADPGELRAAVTELRNDPHVAFAQADHLYQLDQSTFEPNDPFLSSSGSWGQDFSDLWGLDRIRAREAWQITRGAGQIVAVVDTGVDYHHPDIEANVWINPGEDLDGNGVVDPSDENGLDDDGNGLIDDLRGYDFTGFGDKDEDGTIRYGDPDPFDEVGHGTHVSGTVAAVANNGIGIVGVAPEARIMALKGFDAEGRGRDSDLWRAVVYAIENGAHVVNASWSCNPACPENPLAESVLDFADSAGMVFVTSAGNRSFDVVRNAPEKTSAVITVGSVGFDDLISNFSNRGWLVDLLAPGGGPERPFSVFVGRRNILSLAASAVPAIEERFLVGGDYYRLAGTSMSSPHVAGAVALLRSQRPELSPRNVRRLLRIASRDIGESGHDPLHGGGVLDLARLLATPLPDLDLAIEFPSPGSIVDPLAGALFVQARATGNDLVSVSLAFSRGLETNDFEEIARATNFEPDRSIEWDAATQPVGPYVLRLRAELEDGRTVDEFTIVSLETTQPIRLSQSNVIEREPTISGRRVAWQALPAGTVISGQIRAGGFGKDRKADPPIAISVVDRAQRKAVLSGRRLIWLEKPGDTSEDELHGCVLNSSPNARNAPKCRDQLLVPGLTQLDPIRMALGRVLWSSRLNEQIETFGCRWFGGWNRRKSRCTEQAIVDEGPDEFRRLLDFDGRTALFFVSGRNSRLDFCSPVLAPGSCESRPVTIAGFPFFADWASIDQELLAFEIFRPGASILGHCDLDPETGDCANPQVIVDVADGRRPDVSGRRIVWTEFTSGERSSVFTCEVDFANGLCERHRLTGTHAPASEPKIDGHRVVWQDSRLGPSQILGLELPSIRIGRRLVARPGKRTRRLLWASDGNGGPLSLSIESVSGPSPETWKARIESRKDGRALFTFRPPASARTGKPTVTPTKATWRIRGRAENGLETQREVEIELVDRKSAASGSRSRSSRWQWWK